MCLKSQSCSSQVAFQVLSTTLCILTSWLILVQYLQGNFCGSVRVCSSYDSPHPSSYIKTGSRRPALATAGCFQGAAPGFPGNHSSSLPYRETIQSLPFSPPDCLDKYLTDNLFFPSLSLLFHLLPLPILLPSVISKELILDKGRIF